MKPTIAAVVLVLCSGRIVLTQTVVMEKKPPAVAVKNAAGETVASIPIGKGDSVVATVRSLDEKFLFVAVEKHGGAGVLNIVDLKAGTTSNRALIDHPIRLVRLGPEQRLWVLSREEMRSLSETGEVSAQPLLLKFHGGGSLPEDIAGVALPGATISVGADHAAMLLLDGRYNSLHRVALLNLQQLKVDGVLKTRSSGENTKIAARHEAHDFVKGLALSMSPVNLGTQTVTVHTTYSNEFLVTRPDGRFVYTLDAEAHEVTVIDVQTATVVNSIAVDKSVSKFQVSPDGKELLCSGKQLQKIDLQSNKMEN